MAESHGGKHVFRNQLRRGLNRVWNLAVSSGQDVEFEMSPKVGNFGRVKNLKFLINCWLELGGLVQPAGAERRGWEGGAELVEGILPLLHGPGDGGERGVLRPMRQARCGVQALLALQASLVLRGCMPERELEAPQEKVHAAGASVGGPCENQRGKCSSGLAGGSAVGGTHGRADGSSGRRADGSSVKIARC